MFASNIVQTMTSSSTEFSYTKVPSQLFVNQKNISKSVITLIGCWQKLRNRTVSLFLYGKALALVASTKSTLV